jgi:hypothetical protein
LKRLSYIILFAVCCAVALVYSSPADVNKKILHIAHQKDFQAYSITANITADDYEHEAVTITTSSSVKLSSRNEIRNSVRFIKDKSFGTENLSTKQFARSYGIQVVFNYIPQNLGLNVLQRLNI